MQTHFKPERALQLCSKHDKKEQQFLQQATKAGKGDSLLSMKACSPGEYFGLLEKFCESNVRGRPSEAKRFDWSLVEDQRTGSREGQELVAVFKCEEDFVQYFVSKAPHYERALALFICGKSSCSCMHLWCFPCLACY